MYGDNIVFMYNVGIQKQANLVYVIKSSALIEVIRYFKYIYHTSEETSKPKEYISN